MAPAHGDRVDETEGGFEITEERKKEKGSEWDNGGRGKRRGGKEGRKDEPEPKRGEEDVRRGPRAGGYKLVCGPGRLNFD